MFLLLTKTCDRGYLKYLNSTKFSIILWLFIVHAEDAGLTPGSGRSPQKGMTTHSSIFAWRISWTEEPSGLQSMGSQQVRHD